MDSTLKVLKVGLDLGASSIKVSYFNGECIKDFSFPNRVDSDIENGDGTLVVIGDEALRVGGVGGVSNANPKKVNYKNLKHIMLYVTYRLKEELKFKEDGILLDINTCLPPRQFKESKEEYKELISSLSSKGTVGKDTIELKIKSVKVGAEGVVLLKSFNLDSIAEDMIKIMLLDVGSSTTDIVLLEKLGSTWKIKNASTSEAAGSSMCKDISKHLNATSKGDYKWDNLELLGKYQLDQKVTPITEHADKIDATVKKLLSDIEKVGTFAEYMPVLAGQGSKLLSKNKLFNKSTSSIVVDSVNQQYGNSRGCLLA